MEMAYFRNQKLRMLRRCTLLIFLSKYEHKTKDFDCILSRQSSLREDNRIIIPKLSVYHIQCKVQWGLANNKNVYTLTQYNY